LAARHLVRPEPKFLFPAWNLLLDQIFDLAGTFSVIAAQQISDTMCPDKPLITQIGDLIHAL
jgi:hypothetical protein